jgi:RES domain-containing protein
MVYASTSIALACLETLVHLTGDQGLPLQRWLVAIDIPAEHWQQRNSLSPDDLADWDATPPQKASAAWGDRWISGQQSLVSAVPSVIVPEEHNVLINPAHPGRRDLEATVIRRWTYDSRLR